MCSIVMALKPLAFIDFCVGGGIRLCDNERPRRACPNHSVPLSRSVWQRTDATVAAGRLYLTHTPEMIRQELPMDLKSGYPYLAVNNGLMDAFPRLDADLRCDVVVGAGTTGSLIADELAGHGPDPVDSAELGRLAGTRLWESSRPYRMECR